MVDVETLSKTWELVTSRTIETTAVVVDGKISAIKKSDVPLGGLRVYHEGRVGVQGLQGKAVEDLWLKMERNISENEMPDVPLLEIDLDAPKEGPEQIPDGDGGNGRGEEGQGPFVTLTTETFIAEVAYFLNRVGHACPNFVLSNKIKWLEREERIINTKGLKRCWQEAWLEVEVLFTHRSEQAIYSGSFEMKCRDFNPEDHASSETMATTLIGLLEAYEKPIALNEGRWPVVFFEDEYSLMQYFTLHLSGPKWVSGTSDLMKDFEPHPDLIVALNRGVRSYGPPFDACGSVLPNNKIELISGGKVITPYLDCITAKKANLPETAATWSAYDGVPGFGYMPLSFETAQAWSIKQLLQSSGHERALLVFATGGGEYGSDGVFAAPVQLAYVIENGDVVGRMPPIAVSSTVKAMFGEDFVGISSDSVIPGMSRQGVVIEMNVTALRS